MPVSNITDGLLSLHEMTISPVDNTNTFFNSSSKSPTIVFFQRISLPNLSYLIIIPSLCFSVVSNPTTIYSPFEVSETL